MSTSKPSKSTQSTTQAFPHAFTSALSTLASRLRSGALWPLLEITRDETRRDVRVIRGFVEGVVRGALERREEREREGSVGCAREGEGGGTLLDHLVTVSDGEYFYVFLMAVDWSGLGCADINYDPTRHSTHSRRAHQHPHRRT
jgi:hypothetical protein